MSALDRPMRVLTVYDGQPNHRARAVTVRLSDVLAALDVDQREALAQRVFDSLDASIGQGHTYDLRHGAQVIVEDLCEEAGS